ncbi:TetR/AcrR family transcriptional regulator [Fusobacterium necrophorum]|uniref:TetR/AcrR family transcriptional regulator n=1 Tax=Fusobacterium necrophorum TaxID=859 RepID=UPI00254C473D|nr:TetR/AcrR family transcriptional regulator [Fusobacterium necrophorum]MDK4501201.1 TetR/AcrR family transcriptional regulator [Fusobacterium necrophorum]
MTRQKRLPKEERMRQIRNHAKNVFLRKGFDKTTMENVIEETGMSKGGVYRHYSSTTEMLYDLMIDGNVYRNTLIDEYLENNKGKNKFEQIGEILVDKALASTDLMRLYVIFLKSKDYNKDLYNLYPKLKEIAKKQFAVVAKKLEIEEDIFEDEFLVNYINGLILSTEILDARKSFDSQREFLKDTIVNYIMKIEKDDD